jgi:hypothetical protein
LSIRVHTDLGGDSLSSRTERQLGAWTNYFLSGRALLEMTPSGSLRRLRVSTGLDSDPLPSVSELRAAKSRAGNAISSKLGSSTHAEETLAFHRPDVCRKIPLDERWYLVTRGRQVGVFRGAHLAMPLVDGASGAVCIRVASKKKGIALFLEAVAAGGAQIINDDGTITLVEPCRCEG